MLVNCSGKKCGERGCRQRPRRPIAEPNSRTISQLENLIAQVGIHLSKQKRRAAVKKMNHEGRSLGNAWKLLVKKKKKCGKKGCRERLKRPRAEPNSRTISQLENLITRIEFHLKRSTRWLFEPALQTLYTCPIKRRKRNNNTFIGCFVITIDIVPKMADALSLWKSE